MPFGRATRSTRCWNASRKSALAAALPSSTHEHVRVPCGVTSSAMVAGQLAAVRNSGGITSQLGELTGFEGCRLPRRSCAYVVTKNVSVLHRSTFDRSQKVTAAAT